MEGFSLRQNLNYSEVMLQKLRISISFDEMDVKAKVGVSKVWKGYIKKQKDYVRGKGLIYCRI